MKDLKSRMRYLTNPLKLPKVMRGESAHILWYSGNLLISFSVQKELIYDEQDKIQNIQLQEISKLKSLLHFREEVDASV